MSNKELKGGYTFFNTYQTCQRKFYFRYVLRWESTTTNDKMTWGNILHQMTCFLTYHYLDGTMLDLNLADEYNSVVQSEGLNDTALINSGWELLNKWMDEFLPKDKGCEMLFLDEMLGIDVDDFEFLIKPDRVIYDRKRKLVRMFEVKTTGFSLQTVLNNVYLTDQTTAYIWGWNQKFPSSPVGFVIPEIFYARGKKVEIRRGAPIYRTYAEVARFENGLCFLIKEIADKMDDPKPNRFPRKFSCTEGSNFRCEYIDICPQIWTELDKESPPPGFKERVRE